MSSCIVTLLGEGRLSTTRIFPASEAILSEVDPLLLQSMPATYCTLHTVLQSPSLPHIWDESIVMKPVSSFLLILFFICLLIPLGVLISDINGVQDDFQTCCMYKIIILLFLSLMNSVTSCFNFKIIFCLGW